MLLSSFILVIDGTFKDITLVELKALLSLAIDKSTIQSFLLLLDDFISMHNRFPSIPLDLDSFKCNMGTDEVAYLLENCKKFCLIESFISVDDTFFDDYNHSKLDKFQASAILAVEIQKIITRKFIPSKIYIHNKTSTK